MAFANLVNDPIGVYTGNDSIVIKEYFEGIRGGKTLDVTGFAPDVIRAGHVIIQQTSNGEYKPMPVTGSGAVSTLGAITPGSGYTDGAHSNIALTGGSGSGATADIVVTGGVVTSVTIVSPGVDYAGADSLSAANTIIGGGAGSGFAVVVSTISEDPVAYDSLPGGHTYVGILVASILKKNPQAAIMVRGTVNPNTAPFPMTSIQSAFMTATGSNILFRAD